jgi:RNase adaptor protein for sRNA GlmZ degradation
VINKKIRVREQDFKPVYYHFVLVRILQNLGAYGLRGMVENKGTFLASLPSAIKNLDWLLSSVTFLVEMPELIQALKNLILSPEIPAVPAVQTDQLTIHINSFSYKNGIPPDYSGHGGGFVFDCRALPNPGRIDEFKPMTGLDKPVVDYLESKKEVAAFLDQVRKMIIQTVNDYRQRRFNHLMISFGCTGGQHRSVYCAERLKDFLARRTDARIFVDHRELI